MSTQTVRSAYRSDVKKCTIVQSFNLIFVYFQCKLIKTQYDFDQGLNLFQFLKIIIFTMCCILLLILVPSIDVDNDQISQFLWFEFLISPSYVFYVTGMCLWIILYFVG